MLEYVNGKPAINTEQLCEMFQIPSGFTISVGA